MSKHSLERSSQKDSLDHVDDTYQALAEFITGIATSEHKDWALSIGYLLQRVRGRDFLRQLSKEVKAYRAKGKIKPDYMNTEQSVACLQELLDFVDKDMPDQARFAAMKALFLTISTEALSNRDDVVPQQLMRICRSLSSSELIILLATYEVSLKDEWKAERDRRKVHTNTGSTQEWEQMILPVTGLQFVEIIRINDETLIQKRLLSQHDYPDGSGFRYTEHYRLTPLGYSLCKFIKDYQPTQ